MNWNYRRVCALGVEACRRVWDSKSICRWSETMKQGQCEVVWEYWNISINLDLSEIFSFFVTLTVTLFPFVIWESKNWWRAGIWRGCTVALFGLFDLCLNFVCACVCARTWVCVRDRVVCMHVLQRLHVKMILPFQLIVMFCFVFFGLSPVLNSQTFLSVKTYPGTWNRFWIAVCRAGDTGFWSLLISFTPACMHLHLYFLNVNVQS